MDNQRKSRGRKQGSYSQADRLACMMRTLASRATTVNDLAEEFSVTRRQVYRDLQRIEEEGHPLTQSGEMGERMWQLPLGYKGLPPVTVSPYELMSLHLAKSHLAYLIGTPFVEDLDGLISKVQAGLPAKTVNHLERTGQVFAPSVADTVVCETERGRDQSQEGVTTSDPGDLAPSKPGLR